MKRRIGGHVSTSGGLLNAVRNTLTIGGNCLQIFAGSPRTWHRRLYSTQEVSDMKQALHKHDIQPLVIHALYLVNLASDKENLRLKSRQALITDMTNASLLNALGVVVHLGSHQGRGFAWAKDVLIQEITSILDNTPSDSVLILENIAGQKGKVGSLEELGFLLNTFRSPRLKVCLDTAHAFEAGFALHTQAGLDIFVRQVDKYIGWQNVALIHLNDSKTPLGSAHDVHANIGEGFIGKTGIKNIINHSAISHLPLILEVPGFDNQGPDKKNIDIVKSLL